jgi:DNA-binding transcriptional ArsR family regulator
MRRIQYDQIARIGQAMASPVRLRALNLLAQRPWRVGELAQELGESIAATSAHLKVLRAAGMVVEERRGREVWCRVESDEVFRLLAAAQRTAEAILPELREAAREADDDPYLLRNVSLRELAEDIASGRVTIVDLRPGEEYRAGHLPGARSYPFPALEGADLEPLRPIERLVAYCRGPWCLMAREGVHALNERGLPARRLRAGIVDWRAEGLELIRDEPASAKAGDRPRDERTTEQGDA